MATSSRGAEEAKTVEQQPVDIPDLKSTLRKFYMRVHPDLFDSHEEARKKNTESLSLLTGLTDSLASDDLTIKSCSLQFFIRGEHARWEQKKEEKENELSKIGVTIQGDYGAPRNPRYMRSLHRSLSSLFLQSGLDPDFVWGDTFAQASSSDDSTAFSRSRDYEFEEGTLQGYLERNHRLAVLRMERARVLAQRLQLLDITLRSQRFRSIFDNFAGDVATEHHEFQYSCLTELRRLLGIKAPESFFDDDGGGGHFKAGKAATGGGTEAGAKEWKERDSSSSSSSSSSPPPSSTTTETTNSKTSEEDTSYHTESEKEEGFRIELGEEEKWHLILREKLAGRVFVFSSSDDMCRVDGLGRIILPVHLKAEDWLQQIIEKDLSREARTKAKAAQITEQRQRKVGEALGMRHLFCDPDLHSDTSYITFLNRLEESPDALKKFFEDFPERASVPIRVHPGRIRPRNPIHKDLGVLSIPVECTPAKLLHVLQSRGEQAQYIHAAYLKEQKDSDELLLDTKRSLKLQGLRKSSRASDVQMKDCCRRLLCIPMKDRYVFEGLTLIICNNYDVKGNGDVRIKWNWQQK